MLAVTSFNRLKGVRNLDEVVIHDFRAFCLNLAFILDCSKKLLKDLVSSEFS